ncbi:MAG: gene transfer agent family protein [Pontixanthobacter sp.]
MTAAPRNAAPQTANAVRGEASIVVDASPCVLRPTFAGLVAAEEELGSLFELVERAADGKLKLAEVAALFWHCATGETVSREDMGDAVLAMGLARCTPPLRVILQQIVQGSA